MACYLELSTVRSERVENSKMQHIVVHCYVSFSSNCFGSKGVGKVKSAYEPSGPSGRSLSRFLDG